MQEDQENFNEINLNDLFVSLFVTTFEYENCKYLKMREQ